MNIISERIICNYIGLAHFDNKTYKENIEWKRKKNFTGCVYGLQQFLPDSIPHESDVYMIDMNNETNQIVGIGLIKKVYIPKNRSRIYNNPEFNRYVIKSPFYRDRTFLIKKDKEIIEFLENILFKGYSHLKRTSNMTLSFEKLAYAPNIGSEFKIKKNKKRIYKCSTCGLEKKGHLITKQRQINNNKFDGKTWVEIIYNCPGERVKSVKNKYKKCNLCGKSLKGHSGYRPCCVKKRNVQNIKKVLRYFETIFI
ncbi:MAG: hypothetical protein CXT73_04790 [Methanobacteriota archaeon]|nr:MAG: hypothetical protein CXT73_04790 [Euryarchaeota archaeon]